MYKTGTGVPNFLNTKKVKIIFKMNENGKMAHFVGNTIPQSVPI